MDSLRKPTRLSEWQITPGLITPVILENGKVVPGEVREVFTRRVHNGIVMQWYVSYINERGVRRTRIVDPTTLRKWGSDFTYYGMKPNYRTEP